MIRDVQVAEAPPHTVMLSKGPIEIRDYAPMILAEVQVAGNMAAANSRAFRPLADFMLGNNRSAGRTGSARIEMTAPVIQTRAQTAAGRKLTPQPGTDDKVWCIAFVMPASWTVETLAKPRDASIEIRQLPTRRLAAIRFSGSANEKTFEAHAHALSEYLQREGHELASQPIYARYSPPWTPAFLRRNEVLIEIKS